MCMKIQQIKQFFVTGNNLESICEYNEYNCDFDCDCDCDYSRQILFGEQVKQRRVDVGRRTVDGRRWTGCVCTKNTAVQHGVWVIMIISAYK